VNKELRIGDISIEPYTWYPQKLHAFESDIWDNND